MIDESLEKELDGAYAKFWKRLKPLLTEPYSQAVYRMDDYNKLGGVFAAGAMFCTLMTRCWYLHFDGCKQRMNPQVYVIGDPASGKGEIERMNRFIMSPVIEADHKGRQADAAYKRELKKRETSTKARKEGPLQRPEICVRYLPSRTSNAVFFRRLMNAVEERDGERFPLHLYTFDSELDAMTTMQKSGMWINKHDLELKAFHNEETGVDYASNDSVNGLFKIYYNIVATGTPLSLRNKITEFNVADGLCSRIAIFRMCSANFKMEERGKQTVSRSKDSQLKEWACKFDKLEGELKIERLVNYVYKLCQNSAYEAEADHDKVIDYLRKRAVFYATWFTVPRIVARAISLVEGGSSKVKGGASTNPLDYVEVQKSDLAFAKLIYDAVIYWQDFFFGVMLENAWEKPGPKPRRNYSFNSTCYNDLPQQFGIKDVAYSIQQTENAASVQINRWLKLGYIEREERGLYKKIVSKI